MLRDYLDAINRVDVDAAMQLRCPEARVDDRELDLFALQVRQLLERTGPLELSEVTADGAGEAGDSGTAGAISVTYSYEGMEGATVVSVQDEAGGDVLCSWRPAASFEVDDQILDEVLDLGVTEASAAQLLSDSVGDGYELVGDSDEPGSSTSATQVVTRSWQAPDFGGVTVTVGSYADEQMAAADGARLVDEVVVDAVDSFELASAPGAVGIRFLGNGWLFAQPPSSPPYIDRAVLQLGTVLVTVQVSGADPTQLDATLETVVSDVLRRAGR
ncbi:MAG: hypothetical protein ACK4V6_03400 [Microthrixaceae bacterium]